MLSSPWEISQMSVDHVFRDLARLS